MSIRRFERDYTPGVRKLVTNSAQMPYRTFARKESHPARVGALARLSGIAAAPADRCSVLELGCGDGRNIIPIAAAFPNSRFVGIDCAKDLIEKGRRECTELGISNVELIVADLAEYNPPAGEFDYGICHGVYSWVTQELQQRIPQLCKRALAPQGVFFLSYNTLPGWRQRGVVRDIFQIGSMMSQGDDDHSRYTAGMSLLKKLSQEPHLSSYVREAAQRLEHSEPSYVTQEFLGEHNTPLLFVDFMQAAQDAGLQFVSEARIVMMSSEDLSTETNELLNSLGEDVWMREQILDLVRNRTFRETLLCHDTIALNRGLSTKAFKDLIFVANFVPVESGSGGDEEGVLFRERATEREIRAPRGECERALGALARFGVAGATMSTLLESILSEENITEHEIMRAMVTLWKTGFVDALQMSLCGELPEASVSSLARFQAVAAEKVTSFLHESLALSDLERRALQAVQKPLSFQALETLLVPYAPLQEVQQALANLRERGFFR